MNKIYYINDLGYQNGYHKFDNHRLPQAYMELFPWYSIRWDSTDEIIGNNNIIIIQTPTNNELKSLQKVEKLAENNIIFINQESSIFDWFDWPAPEQELYINLLSKCKAFLYHSEHDKNIMKIFTKNFVKYPGCINFSIPERKNYGDGNYVFIPNPIKRYQRGMIGHKIVNDTIKDTPIYSMNYNYPELKYNLSFPDCYKLENIQIQNRLSTSEWLGFIYNSKFGVDIHREFSGGNCALEFGALGTPLIGNINLDIQRDIFPDLSFEFNDYEGIKKVINLLLNDKDFYEECSQKALNNTREKYNSKLIVDNFKQEIEKFL